MLNSKWKILVTPINNVKVLFLKLKFYITNFINNFDLVFRLWIPRFTRDEGTKNPVGDGIKPFLKK